ncbi:MAG TPA: hypothetical protein PK847_12165 [Candidatus Sumerlaeota bacterium]|nr:hypothetical protein [Candidatus Sumerlaeota bacterium]
MSAGRGLCRLIGLSLLAAWAAPEARSQPAPAPNDELTRVDDYASSALRDLFSNIPHGFPRFEIEGRARESRLLTHLLWYHFINRPGNGRALFNKEYLTLADMWLGEAAVPRQQNQLIQEIHRENISAVKLDAEGYVHSHQHFSHAHEHGWPFPMWTQAEANPDAIRGIAAGWHFQRLEDNAPGWVWDYLRSWGHPEYYGEGAAASFELVNLESRGIANQRWHLRATGPSPALLTPAGMPIDAFNAPFLQIRWKRSGEPPHHRRPYVEWLRDEDQEWSPQRRVHIYFDHEEHAEGTDLVFSMIEMYRHPLWRGQIKRLRFCLAPGETGVEFEIDSIFTVYDTRHTINNPIFILACWNTFRWTGDLAFLRANINRMRLALRYQQYAMSALELGHIRNPWVGHDGLAGWQLGSEGGKDIQSGHGIGNNYWDLMPFGRDDLYATSQYHAATLAMAEVEEAVLDHPGWDLPRGPLGLDPTLLRRHAEEVRQTANALFWNPETGRFHAAIDAEGKPHDYGFTYLNLEAIWYGLASEEHAAQIMSWINGDRFVVGDTSMGKDLYAWEFAPRTTTRRNLEWYGPTWTNPEEIAWGDQVQDGGAVLGFSFFDLWARLRVLGPDNAWNRLGEIIDWQERVWRQGDYRDYYAAAGRGKLQGCGTPGGLGIDCEFYESSLLPAIVVYGFLGLDPRADCLAIHPRLPGATPAMTVRNVLYHWTPLDITAGGDSIEITLKETPLDPIQIQVPEGYRLAESDAAGPLFQIAKAGAYRFER